MDGTMTLAMSGSTQSLIIWGGMVVLITILFVSLANIPYKMAKKKNHPSAGGIKLMGYIGIFIWPVWIAALIIAIVAKDNSRNTMNDYMAARSAMQNNSPGLFLVSGVDKETKMDTRLRIQADNADNAKVKAELQGMVVTGVKLA